MQQKVWKQFDWPEVRGREHSTANNGTHIPFFLQSPSDSSGMVLNIYCIIKACKNGTCATLR